MTTSIPDHDGTTPEEIEGAKAIIRSLRRTAPAEAMLHRVRPIGTHPFGSVAYFIEKFRTQTTTTGLLNMLVGAVEGTVQFSADDTQTVKFVRHALAAEHIVAGELKSARALAVAEQHELAEPSPLQTHGVDAR